MTSTEKRILVAGGAGFLGSYLCDALLKGGHTVCCLNNFSGHPYCNKDPFSRQHEFSPIERDVTQALKMEIDQIDNLVCPASPVHYQAAPLATMRTRPDGAFDLLDLANEDSGRILQASTSGIYGDPFNHPRRESDRGNVKPNGIWSRYDGGKRAAETMYRDHHRAKISYEPLPEDGPCKRRPDISLAIRELEWQSKAALQQSLKKTISFLQTFLFESRRRSWQPAGSPFVPGLSQAG